MPSFSFVGFPPPPTSANGAIPDLHTEVLLHKTLNWRTY